MDAPMSLVDRRWRRRRLAWLIGGLALLVVSVNLGQWLATRRIKARLDDDLGQHLAALAQVGAGSVDGEMLKRWELFGVDSNERDRLAARLTNLQRTQTVSNATLLDLDGGTWIDLAAVVDVGEFNPVVELDRAEFTLASSGVEAVSALRETEGSFIKAAYAPVVADDGTPVAVLGVEGASDLFRVLADVRRTGAAAGLATALSVLVLGTLLVRVAGSLGRAERELVRTEALTTMGRMTAVIAHEVRNPLGIIRASAERLARRTGGDDAALAGSIVEEVDRLNRVVTGYLSFAQGRSVAFDKVAVVPLVERTLALAADELAGIEVERHFADPGATVRGDPAQLRQVILNLVLNAGQAMSAGGRLQVSVAATGGDVQLAVADTGEGIPARRLGEVWRPFYTSKTDGSGLGLAVSKRIVEEHGGTIALDSKLGRGTTVAVTLPAAKEESVAQDSGGG